MRSPKRSAPWLVPADRRDAPAWVIARLVPGPPGALLVDFGQGPRPARHAARLRPQALVAAADAHAEVMVLLEAGDPARPVIVDLVVDPAAAAAAPGGAADAGALDARVDGRRVVIEAEREILLRCGKGYILIREDGQVVVKGTNVLSRSTGANKIKGGTVRIN